MDIGEQQRIITVEPEPVEWPADDPVPEHTPQGDPVSEPEPAPPRT